VAAVNHHSQAASKKCGGSVRTCVSLNVVVESVRFVRNAVDTRGSRIWEEGSLIRYEVWTPVDGSPSGIHARQSPGTGFRKSAQKLITFRKQWPDVLATNRLGDSGNSVKKTVKKLTDFYCATL